MEVDGLVRPSMAALGLPSDFVRKGLLLLRSGYVRELAAASYPHIHCGGGDFPFIAGGVCGERRHEVDFKDDPVAVDVSMGESAVQITLDAVEDTAPPHERRFATVAIPREQLMAALGAHLRERKDHGDPARPRLVRSDD